jgi:carboxymethylenebutenolidase
MINLYDEYTHITLDRRAFIDKLTALVGSTATALALLNVLQCNYAEAATVAPDDGRLASEKITYGTPKGQASGYLSRPKAKGKRPAILVVHENRGLNPHIEDVVRRFAVEGFLALGLDLLSPYGGTPSNDEEAGKLFAARVDRSDTTIPVATVSFLKTHPESTGKVGAVGFCFGGGMVNLLAMNSPDLNAAVAYYGPIPADKSKVKDIKAQMMLHYAGNDENVNKGIPDYKAALEKAGVKFELFMYDGAQHAFNNDASAARYNKAAADLAWSRTVGFLKKTLA